MNKSTTPSAYIHCNMLIICVLRPPLLEKEGKLMNELIFKKNPVTFIHPPCKFFLRLLKLTPMPSGVRRKKKVAPGGATG